ncbi:hypothetical protein Hanom_Chr17g01538491 [Helianthus anomalus]
MTKTCSLPVGTKYNQYYVTTIYSNSNDLALNRTSFTCSEENITAIRLFTLVSSL